MVEQADGSDQSDAPPARPYGRSLSDFLPLNEAEQKLLEACRTGEPCVLGDTRPEEARKEITVRASFVRFLALGGDEQAPVHEHGVRLGGAWLAGPLALSHADLPRPLMLALCRIERVEVSQTRLWLLSLEGSRLERGLSGEGLHCTGALLLRNGFHAQCGAVLQGATIEGTFSCSKALFEAANGEIPALNFDLAHVTGNVFLDEQFHARGEVRLLGASIAGSLQCSGGKFENKGGKALSCDRAKINGGVVLGEGFLAFGEVRLVGASIGSVLNCCGAQFRNDGGEALLCQSAQIGGHAFFSKGFQSLGAVRLNGVRIAGALDCSGGVFSGSGKAALVCDSARITESLRLCDGFLASGEVRLVGAQIGGDLVCTGGSFSTVSGDALSCGNVEVSGCFFLRGLAEANGAINLAPMQVGILCDDTATWQKARLRLVLDGFTYRRILGGGDTPIDAASRIAWLDSQLPAHLNEEFRPQPWEQLISVLRAMGHLEEARQVAIAKQDRLRAAGKVRPILPWLLHWLYGLLVGYGYRPLRLLKILLILWVFASFAFWVGAAPRTFDLPGRTDYWIEAAKPAYDPTCLAQPAADPWLKPCKPQPPAYQNFAAPIYALETLLPIVNFGHRAEWKPALPEAGEPYWSGGRFLQWLSWLLIIFGWVSGLLLVAVLGNLVKKD